MLIISLLAIFAGRHTELVLESAGEPQAGGQQQHSRHSVVIVFAHVLSLYCFYNLLGMHCQYGHKESAGPVPYILPGLALPLYIYGQRLRYSAQPQ